MKKDALIFFSFRSHKLGYIEMLFERLTTKAQDFPLNLHRGSLNDLHIQIKDNRMSITESLTGRDLASFDVIYFELWYKAQQQALAAARYAKTNNTPFFSQELLNILPLTKVGELACLADNDISIPNTFISSRRELKKVFKRNPPIAYPLIVKAADGYGGKNNYLINDYKELAQTLDSNPKLQFVIQEFIPNDCDYRCVVFGGEIKLALKRSRDQASDSHLNNTSQGAIGEMVAVESLPVSARNDVVHSAQVLNREQFAGVDLMFDKSTGQHYILEVNQTPQIEIGAEIDKKMTALLDYMTSLAGATNPTEKESA